MRFVLIAVLLAALTLFGQVYLEFFFSPDYDYANLGYMYQDGLFFIGAELGTIIGMLPTDFLMVTAELGVTYDGWYVGVSKNVAVVPFIIDDVVNIKIAKRFGFLEIGYTVLFKPFEYVGDYFQLRLYVF